MITKTQGYLYLGVFYPTFKEAKTIATKNKIDDERYKLEREADSLLDERAIRNAVLNDPDDREAFIRLGEIAKQYNALEKEKEKLR